MKLRVLFFFICLLIPLSLHSQQQKKEKTSKLNLTVDVRVGEFVKIPSGEFMMGSKYGDEKPIHKVLIRNSFEIGKYEITQQQWKSLMGNNPSRFKGENLPVTNVSWFDIQKFIIALNKKSQSYLYRLPTEAEWEYVCRAGTKEDYAGNLDEIAWYNKNAGEQLHLVGQKQPNPWGIYDMHGNVFEWCEDWYGDYPNNINSFRTARVFRGGAYNLDADAARTTARGYSHPGSRYDVLGFRLVRTLLKKRDQK